MKYNLLERINGLRISYNVPLKEFTTFRIGGPCDCLAEPETPEAAIELMRILGEENAIFSMIGNGSNTLVSDLGVRGVVVHPLMARVEKLFGNRLRAEAGIALPKLACIARDDAKHGLAFAQGIPGALGGALSMNAGAYNHSLSEIVESVSCVFCGGLVRSIPCQACSFGYRESIFAHDRMLILDATLCLSPGDKEQIGKEMQEYAARRSASQPLSMPSAGSAFKRPEGHFAGKLIQDAGLKGFRIGGACVSEKHAGFIVNEGNASADDVRALIRHIQKTVSEQFGVDLQPEIRMLGFDQEQ